MTQEKSNEILAIFIFGSVWGLFQSVLTAGMVKFSVIPLFFEHLHTCPCPLAAVLIGIPIMGAVFAVHKKPSMLLGIGLVASLFSFLVIPFLSVPAFSESITTYPIVNPALANLFASLVLCLMLSLTLRREKVGTPLVAGIGGLAMFLSSSIWIFTVVSIGAPILGPSMLSSPLAYILRVSPIWGALSVLTLPIGYLLGPRVQSRVQRWSRANPLPHKMAWILLFGACWIASLAIAPLIAT